jgi:O-antigen/teichoic acid export membrane protein
MINAKEFRKYIISNYVFRLTSIIMSLVARRVLGPELVGAYAFAYAINTYFDLVPSGLRSSIEVELPRYADTQTEEEQQYIDTLRWLLKCIVTVSFLLYLILAFIETNPAIKLSFVFLSVLNGLECFVKYYQIYFKTKGHLHKISRNLSGIGLLGPVLSFALSKVLSLFGFLLGRLIQQGLLLVQYTKAWVKQQRKPINRKAVVFIIKLGIKMLIYSAVVSYLQSIDKIVVKKLFDLKSVGDYSIGDLVFSNMLLLPVTYFAAYFPQLVKYIKAGEGKTAIELSNKSLRKINTIIVPLIGFMVIASELVFSLILPGFTKSADIAKWLLIAFFFYSNYLPNYYILGSAGESKAIIASTIIVVFVTLIGYSFCYLFKASISYVAITTVVGYWVLFITSRISAEKVCAGGAFGLKSVFTVTVVGGLIAGGILIGSMNWIIQCVYFIILSVAFFYINIDKNREKKGING